MSKKTVYSFNKSDQEEVRISAGEFKNKIYFDIRVFFAEKDSGDYKPSKRGITLSLDYLKDVKKGIQCLEKNFADQVLA